MWQLRKISLVGVLHGPTLGIHGKGLSNGHLLGRPITNIGLHHAHVCNHFHTWIFQLKKPRKWPITFGYATKDGMLSVEPLSRAKCYKKLGAVCILPRIGH